MQALGLVSGMGELSNQIVQDFVRFTQLYF